MLNRPPNLLYPLECDSGREIEMMQDGEQLKETEEITSNTLRPTRAAAITARQQMQKTPFFRNRNFFLAWVCRGVSVEN